MRNKTEIQPGEEPSVGGEPDRTAEAAPVAPLHEPDGQPRALAAGTGSAIEEDKELRAPVEVVAPIQSVSRAKRRPSDDLLHRQLIMSVPGRYGIELRSTFMQGTVDVYRSLRPKDPIESIIALHLAALNNLTMDCVERAAVGSAKPARDVELRYAIKGSSHVLELIKALESRRGQGGQNVTVGQVKVEAGGRPLSVTYKPGTRESRRRNQSRFHARRRRRATTKPHHTDLIRAAWTDADGWHPQTKYDSDALQSPVRGENSEWDQVLLGATKMRGSTEHIPKRRFGSEQRCVRCFERLENF